MFKYINLSNKVMIVFTDGGARGNPGPAAIGVVIFDDNEKFLTDYKERIGKSTNNQAEYKAIIKALELVDDTGVVNVFSDSQLVVRQLNGVYKVKKVELKPLFDRVKELEKGFKTVVFSHVPRSNHGIVLADRLVNAALDGL